MSFTPYTKPNKSEVSKIVRDGYGPEWFSICKQVRIRDNYCCVFCKTPENAKAGIYHEVHHVRALSRGGTTTLSNLCLCCKTCHEKRPGHSHLKETRTASANPRKLATPPRPLNPNFRSASRGVKKTPIVRYSGKP